MSWKDKAALCRGEGRHDPMFRFKKFASARLLISTQSSWQAQSKPGAGPKTPEIRLAWLEG
jgi:hypothetical protein